MRRWYMLLEKCCIAHIDLEGQPFLKRSFYDEAEGCYPAHSLTR